MNRLQPHHKRLLVGGAIAAGGAALLATTLAPSGPVTVKPGDDVARVVKSGVTVTLQRGDYPGGITLSGLNHFKIQGAGAVLNGGVNGIKFDRCTDFEVDGLTSKNAGSYGFFLSDCDRFVFRNAKSDHAGRTGFLTTRITNGQFLDCAGLDSRDEHGIYISEKAVHVLISGGEYSRCGKSGAQVNLDKGRGSDIQLTGLTCDGNQKVGGAAAIQLAYVDGGSVTDCVISNHKGRAGVALFWGTRGVAVDRNRFGFSPTAKTPACISIDKSAVGIVGSGNQYARGVRDVEKQ